MSGGPRGENQHLHFVLPKGDTVNRFLVRCVFDAREEHHLGKAVHLHAVCGKAFRPIVRDANGGASRISREMGNVCVVQLFVQRHGDADRRRSQIG